MPRLVQSKESEKIFGKKKRKGLTEKLAKEALKKPFIPPLDMGILPQTKKPEGLEKASIEVMEEAITKMEQYKFDSKEFSDTITLELFAFDGPDQFAAGRKKQVAAEVQKILDAVSSGLAEQLLYDPSEKYFIFKFDNEYPLDIIGLVIEKIEQCKWLFVYDNDKREVSLLVPEVELASYALEEKPRSITPPL